MGRAKGILLSFLMISVLAGCTSVKVNSDSIKVHWMKKGEKAPFSGILMNDYTYYRLVKKAKRCGGER